MKINSQHSEVFAFVQIRYPGQSVGLYVAIRGRKKNKKEKFFNNKNSTRVRLSIRSKGHVIIEYSTTYTE